MNELGPGQLARLFDAHAAALVLYARQLVDGAAAEDVVQDAFVRLLGQPKAPENPRAWLFAAVRNGAIDQRRRAGRRATRQRAAATGEMWDTRPEDLLDAARVAEVLGELPVERREVIVMRVWGELTFAEIAAVTGRAQTSVYEMYRAGLGQIRARLERPCRKNP